jgi:hypothetical protein
VVPDWNPVRSVKFYWIQIRIPPDHADPDLDPSPRPDRPVRHKIRKNIEILLDYIHISFKKLQISWRSPTVVFCTYT